MVQRIVCIALLVSAGEAAGFTAVFTEVRGGNHWIETSVSADRALLEVDYRINGGRWLPLTMTVSGSSAPQARRGTLWRPGKEV